MITKIRSRTAALLLALATLGLAACGGGDRATPPIEDAAQAAASNDATAADEGSPGEASASAPAPVASDDTPNETEGDGNQARILAAGTTSGLGGGVTGGRGGQIVHVTTPQQLTDALCDPKKNNGYVCRDDTPRVVSVDAQIDFRRIGTASATGCNYGSAGTCSGHQERLACTWQDKDKCLSTYCPNAGARFEVSYDVAGVEKPLLVGSNKTIIGKQGGQAAILGKGLGLWGGVHNVIIRNLLIGEINPGIIFAGDAIMLGDTRDVLIDHNRFRNIGRQMLVSGYESSEKGAKNVTLSWNDFDGTTSYPALKCDGTHYWNHLLVGSGESIVFAHNWFHNFSGRGPAVHGKNQFVLLTNNLFQNGKGHALDPSPSNDVLLEGNAFINVDIPILFAKAGHGSVFAPLAGVAPADAAQCAKALGRACALNALTNSPATNFTTDAHVLQHAAAVNQENRLPAPAGKVSKLVIQLPANTGPK